MCCDGLELAKPAKLGRFVLFRIIWFGRGACVFASVCVYLRVPIFLCVVVVVSTEAITTELCRLQISMTHAPHARRETRGWDGMQGSQLEQVPPTRYGTQCARAGNSRSSLLLQSTSAELSHPLSSRTLGRSVALYILPCGIYFLLFGIRIRRQIWRVLSP